jgi:hypothetical protein
MDVLPFSSATVAIRPAQAAIGQEPDRAIGGGGLEDIAAEVTQGMLAVAHSGDVNHPALFPDFGRQGLEGLGIALLEGAVEEGAQMQGQRSVMKEELVAAGNPATAIGA